MNRAITILAVVCGALFGTGLVLSGMTMPARVIGFLDFFGDWDPSLAFVMGGAVITFAGGFLLSKRRPAPIIGATYLAPETTAITPRLLVGAAIFGVGWGLGGFCPGPALVAAGSGGSAIVFIVAMAAGMALSRPFRK